MFSNLWNDDCGVVTIEYLVLGTFLALALIVGVTALAAAVNSELSELANAVGSFSQNYTSSGYTHCTSSKEGSGATNDTAAQPTITSTAPVIAPINDNQCN